MKLFGALFTFLLAAQFLVPLMPSWGEFVPHGHYARTRLSAQDWNAHLQEHRQAAEPISLYHTAPGESKIVSTLSHDGLMTLYVPLAVNAAQPVVRELQAFVYSLVTHSQVTRAMSYPPPLPPPVA
jgi:hypothetical protein